MGSRGKAASEEIFNLLKEKFGESVIELKTDVPVEHFIIVDPLSVDKISMFLRDENELQFDSLMNLSGVDDANGEKVKDENVEGLMYAGRTFALKTAGAISAAIFVM